MKGFPLFKLSRYFFVLFLIITVLPLVALLLWSQYDLDQNLLNRQRQFLEMDSRRVHDVFQEELAVDSGEIEETASSVAHKTLSLPEYKGIFNAQEVWWLDSPEAAEFLRHHPEAHLVAKHGFHDVVGDYFPNPKAIQSFFVVPMSNPHGGLLLVKNIPAEVFAPNGPYRINIYAGGKPNPASIVFQSDFMWHRPGFSHGFMPLPKEPHHGFGVLGSHHKPCHDGPPPDALSNGPPQSPSDELPNHLNDAGAHLPPCHGHDPIFKQGFGPPPPPGWRDPNYNPKLSKVMVEKTIHLTNQSGMDIATLEIKALAPPHPPGSSVTRNNQWISLLIMIAGLLTSLLAGNYLRKNFIQPLTQLAEVATRVQEGDLNSRVETENIKQTDVRLTLEKFNAMLSGLSEKEKLRNSFISNLTHDFRTPLVAQKRSLEILAQEMKQLDLQQQEILAQGLLKNSDHLLTMVNQLLETYQTEAGSFHLKLEQESIPAMVSQCFEQLAPLAEERQITLSQNFPDDFPNLQVDAYYLKRVFINLLGNAIENIPKKSKIEITGQCPQPGRVEIHVKDNGRGISPDEQRQLFERYYAGTGDTRKLGSGLGLYICAVLVAAHQGNISVDSVEGSYTDFIIDLPIILERGIE